MLAVNQVIIRNILNNVRSVECRSFWKVCAKRCVLFMITIMKLCNNHYTIVSYPDRQDYKIYIKADFNDKVIIIYNHVNII